MFQPNKSTFRLTETDLTVIFHHPGKMAAFVGVFVTVIFCTVILIKVDTSARTGSLSLVSTQTGKSQADERLQMMNNYEKDVRGVLNQHLINRTGQGFENEMFCQDAVNQTVEKVLNLIVPTEYKEFHLKLVVLLDKEYTNCVVQDKELDNDWGVFLSEYKWLTE